MKKPEWKCAASHCKGKNGIHKDMCRVWRCSTCKKMYHTGCSGGAPEIKCDKCLITVSG